MAPTPSGRRTNEQGPGARRGRDAPARAPVGTAASRPAPRRSLRELGPRGLDPRRGPRRSRSSPLRTAGGQTDRQTGGLYAPGSPARTPGDRHGGLPTLPVRSTPTSILRSPIEDVPDRVVGTTASAGERTNEQGGYTPAGRARASPGRDDSLEVLPERRVGSGRSDRGGGRTIEPSGRRTDGRTGGLHASGMRPRNPRPRGDRRRRRRAISSSNRSSRGLCAGGTRPPEPRSEQRPRGPPRGGRSGSSVRKVSILDEDRGGRGRARSERQLTNQPTGGRSAPERAGAPGRPPRPAFRLSRFVQLQRRPRF